jgi:phenol hydroxylase P1 protein
MNNSAICAYGFGAAVTQPAMFHAMDHLGIAQYLTRIGLELADPAVLDQAKEAWMNDAVWQGLRRYIENTFVLSDWFELFVAQNLVLDGLIYPLVFEAFDKALTRRGGGAISMLTQFMREWRNESVKWVDATIKTAAAESPANLALLQGWVANWRAQAYEAVKPLAELALGQEAGAALDDIATAFDRNLNKLGLSR